MLYQQVSWLIAHKLEEKVQKNFGLFCRDLMFLQSTGWPEINEVQKNEKRQQK